LIKTNTTPHCPTFEPDEPTVSRSPGCDALISKTTPDCQKITPGGKIKPENVANPGKTAASCNISEQDNAAWPNNTVGLGNATDPASIAERDNTMLAEFVQFFMQPLPPHLAEVAEVAEFGRR